MTIDVYGAETCTQCRNLKQYLTDNNVKFVYHDVHKEKEAVKKLISLGLISLPITIVDNSGVIIGFDISRLKEIVNGYK